MGRMAHAALVSPNVSSTESDYEHGAGCEARFLASSASTSSRRRGASSGPARAERGTRGVPVRGALPGYPGVWETLPARSAGSSGRKDASMGCLFVLIAALSPRLAVFLMWIFTPWVDRAFGPIIWPILGIIFLPLTMLMYVILWNTGGRGVTGWEWILVILAVVGDLASYGG